MADHGYYLYEEFLRALEIGREPDNKMAYTSLELLQLTVDAVTLLSANWYCFSCGKNTFALGEDYYVHDDLWYKYGVEGVLCIGCLETRMGRKLTPEDFLYSDRRDKITKNKIKSIRTWRERINYQPSARLIDRCGGAYEGRDGYFP